MIDWEVKAEELANCNCNYGCPCQFGVLPTDGTCEAAVIYDIESGHYGDTRLDGLRVGALYKWPGAIHEGNGEMVLIVDDSASDAQVAAIEAIMTGQDTVEMGTMWFVFSAMSPTKHATLRAPITASLDRDARQGSATVGDFFEISAKPIPNIVTGDPHRIGINLPHGFEFRHAEMASGRTKTGNGALSLTKNSDTHAHFAALHLTGQGVAA
ncbi:DUF1326 domain-containing protein [Shimia abyssi]|uniref:DUF1326 domain-containing protein n=1 Tax=Shimia abyssi TaxID=1662395 RepID=A0A2P8FJX8_9RHOB|nr:DUF1326 domain-containing protein [Shimia abyssi]PSL22015.1 hypothetical protein CLV88_101440 [Shimia abyssi]